MFNKVERRVEMLPSPENVLRRLVLTLEKKGRSCLDKFLHGLMMETNDKKVRAPTRQSTELGESVEESLHGNMEALAIQSIYFDTGSVQHFVKTNNFCC